MARFIIIRPGQTDFDQQGRIKGCLSISLNQEGADEVAQTVKELQAIPLVHIYCSPSLAAVQTAEALAGARGLHVTPLASLANLDRGLWQGKRVGEIKRQQPKAFRRWQESPEATCPPEGEMLSSARLRVGDALARLAKKHKMGNVAIVIPEPLATIVVCMLQDHAPGNLWSVECASGYWEAVDAELQHAR